MTLAVSQIQKAYASNTYMESFEPGSTRKANSRFPTLLESYCNGCGLFIAASPLRRVLEIMEEMHRCPAYFHETRAEPERRQKRFYADGAGL